MTRIWAAGLLLRRLRGELGIVLLITALVGGTTFLFAAAPRVFNRVADDAMQAAISSAQPIQRTISLSVVGDIPPASNGAVSRVADAGDRLAKKVPPSITDAIGEETYRITSPRLSVADPPRYDTRVALTYRDGLIDDATLAAGRWPADRGDRLQVRQLGVPRDPDEPEPEAVVIEVAVSAAAATELGLAVGDRLSVDLDGTDGMIRFFRLALLPTELEVVGLYEPIDPGAIAWAVDRDLVGVVQHGTDDVPVGWVGAVIAGDAYRSVWTGQLPFQYAWRYLIDPSGLDAGRLPQIQADLRRLGQAVSNDAALGDQIAVVTGLPGVLERVGRQLAATESILTMALIGPFALAAGALATVALLLARRRRPVVSLARGRGAAGSLVLGAQLWESILVAGGATAAGLLLAVAVVMSRPNGATPLLAAAVGVAALVTLLGAAWPAARRPLGDIERDDIGGSGLTIRRLVIELTVVGVAVTAAILLRERGLTAEGVAGSSGTDPLLASVPVLTGLAAGIVALRIYPLPIRALGWLAARGRGFVAVVGLRTIARHASSTNLPVLVLMLTTAFGAFASVVATSLDRGQLAASYQEVGADYRIENALGGVLAPDLDPMRVAGVSAVAPSLFDPSARFSVSTIDTSTITFNAVDPDLYTAVTVGTAADPQWPDAFLVPPGGRDIGTESNPIPAILSTRLPAGSGSLPVGATFAARVTGTRLVFQVAERRPTFPGIDERQTFVVAPFEWVRAGAGRFLSPTILWVRGAADARSGIDAEIARARATVRVITREAAYVRLHDTPLVAAIGQGYAVALLIALGYMGFAIVGAMVLSSARRTRDLAFLRTLGVSAAQSLALTAVEYAPPVLLGILPGVALGIGIAALVAPGLELSQFAGGDPVPLAVDWPALLAIGGGVACSVGLAIVVGTWLSRRARMTDALRIGEH